MSRFTRFAAPQFLDPVEVDANTMQHFAISSIASHDADFDRVPGLVRYAPV